MNELTPIQPESSFVLAEPVQPIAAPASPLQPRRLLFFLRKYWWIPLCSIALCSVAGGLLAFYATPTFVSRARMWETLKLQLPEGAMFSEDVQNFVGTQTELLQSETLRQQALTQLKQQSNAVPLDKKGLPLPVAIRVAGGGKSSVFVLEASSANPAFTQFYLDALMGAYLDYKRNVRRVVSGDTLASITEQVQRTERDLKSEQDAFMAYQRTNNLAVLQQEGTIAGGYLATLKTKLSDLQLEQRLLAASAVASTNASETNPAAFNGNLSGAGGSSPSAAQDQQQSAYRDLALLKAQRDKLSKYLRAKHPKIVKLDTDIDRAERLLALYQHQNEQQLAVSRQEVELKLSNVQEAIKEWESKVIDANTRIAEAERLRLNVQRIQSVYDRLVALVQNVGISRNIDQETLSVLEPATPAIRSYAHEKNLLTGWGVAGVGLGCAIIVLFAFLDDRFTAPSDVNERLGQAVVGQVPEIPQLGTRGALDLAATIDPRHLMAESYRSLRSALLFLDNKHARPQVMLITSAVPNEGKSTISVNLARTLAQGGARVLLVDADLRKGYLHRQLKLQKEPGLSDILLGTEPQSQAQKAIQTVPGSGLSFLASGSVLEDPGDLFLASRWAELLQQWRQEYQYVLIDSSPVFAADDATTLAPGTDGVLFVVRSQFSRTRAAREAINLLQQRQVRILGVVFNGADAQSHSYGYYKYSQYYSGKKAEQET